MYVVCCLSLFVGVLLIVGCVVFAVNCLLCVARCLVFMFVGVRCWLFVVLFIVVV